VNRSLTVVLVVVLGFAGAGFAAASALADAHSLPANVRIAGVRVGGLQVEKATAIVRTAFAKPLPLLVAGTPVKFSPARLATAYVSPAVGRARSAAAGTNVHLAVSVDGAAVRSAVSSLAARFDRRPRPAVLRLVHGRPQITRDITGRSFDRRALVAKIVRALTSNVRRPLAVRLEKISAHATARSIGTVILINRALNRLTLYRNNDRIWRSFPVATGQTIYPTPAGRFSIIVKWVNPTWYPPTNDAWAKGLKPVPPGPNNPLGTRWMGLSSPGIGIHGTDEPTSIGYSESHGCIRMQVADSEWLFGHVKVGATVFIV
jgi:lipoprotein-anchoring transpeptidase ErfK/SrfK